MKFYVNDVVQRLPKDGVILGDVFVLEDNTLHFNDKTIQLNYGDMVQHGNNVYYVNRGISDVSTADTFLNEVEDIWSLNEGKPPRNNKRYFIVTDGSDEYLDKYKNQIVSVTESGVVEVHALHGNKIFVKATGKAKLIESYGLVDYHPTLEVWKQYTDSLVEEDQKDELIEEAITTLWNEPIVRFYENESPEELKPGSWFIDENGILSIVVSEQEYRHAGARGYTGSQGEIGYTGSKGDIGNEGPQGPIGYTGSRGQIGFTGSIGPTGFTGSVGQQGDRGGDGAPGPRGYTGSVGERGERGYVGSSGEQGIRGYTGSKGVKGDRGPEGKRGPKGDRGPAGKDGKDGSDVSIKKLEKEFNLYKTQVNQQLSTLGGGGSVRILDMDDVVFNKPSQLSNNDILIFDKSINKFKAINFVTVIENIRVDLEMQYNRFIDVVGSYTYIGEADPGTATAASAWRIKRIYDVDGDDYEIVWAEGTADFDKVWDDRLTYSYS